MNFDKLEDKRKSVHVVDEILKAARLQDLEIGEKLPPESKLAEMMGVSRASVREALAALRLTGIVETRVGDGTYLIKLPKEPTQEEDLLKSLREDRPTLQLQEARSAFERGIMRPAANKFSDKDVSCFEGILKEMEAALSDNDYDKFINHHKDFHLAIAKATDNVLVVDIIKHFKEIMDKKMWRDLEEEYYLPQKKEYLYESFKIHQNIFKALKNHDEEAAIDRMEEHFDRYT